MGGELRKGGQQGSQEPDRSGPRRPRKGLEAYGKSLKALELGSDVIRPAVVRDHLDSR